MYEARMMKLKVLSTIEMCPGPLDTDCWIWTGYQNPVSGYGQLRWGKRPWQAHRFAYTAFICSIPDDLDCLHLCDVRPCVNPDHLYLGTDQDNQNDRKLRGPDYSYLRGEGNPHAAVTEVEAAEIKWLALEGLHSQQAIADFYGIDQTQVSRIKLGISWPHVVPVPPTEAWKRYQKEARADVVDISDMEELLR